MPLYTYQCTACQHGFEVLATVSNYLAEEDNPCPKCGKKKVKRTIGLPAFINATGSSPLFRKTPRAYQERKRQIAKNVKKLGGTHDIKI